MDPGLPDGDGLEILKRIRSVPELAALPVVVLTGRGEDALAARAYGLGANSFVRKDHPDRPEPAALGLAHYWLRVNGNPAGRA